MEAELIRDLGSVHGVGEILLVGEDKEEGIAKLILVEHTLQLLAGLRDTFPVVGIDNENNALSVLEVCGEKDTTRCAGTQRQSQSDGHVRR